MRFNFDLHFTSLVTILEKGGKKKGNIFCHVPSLLKASVSSKKPFFRVVSCVTSSGGLGIKSYLLLWWEEV